MTAKVAILVPGIMGSELWKGDQLIWPGPFKSLFSKYKLMEELLEPSLTVGDVIRKFSVSRQYDALIDKFAAGAFTEGNGTLWVCPYDWRKDNAEAAELLALKIEAVRKAHPGDLEITIAAHSMGGLVSRYYLESGLFTGRAGFDKVRRLITLGTPHRGSPLVLTAARAYDGSLFLSAEQVQRLANDSRYPSTYQLLPPENEPFAWDDIAGQTEFAPFDVYNRAKELGLNPDNIEKAREFRKKLAAQPPEGVRYFYFAGTRMLTLSNIRIVGGFNLLPVEIDDAGDGTVPTWSAWQAGIQGQFVGGEHGTIYKNTELLQTLGALLGQKGVWAAVAPEVQLAVRDRVVAPGERVHVALTFPSAVQKLTGDIVIEQLVMDPVTGERAGKGPLTYKYPIRYQGLNAEKIGLTFDAPPLPDPYAVSFVPENTAEPAATDELLVQDTN